MKIVYNLVGSEIARMDIPDERLAAARSTEELRVDTNDTNPKALKTFPFDT
jgi:hypothetical protein